MTFVRHARSIWVPWLQQFTGKKTVEEVVRALDQQAGQRMRTAFARVGLKPGSR